MSSDFVSNKNLKKIRKHVGLIQEEFAHLLKIKRSLLGAYEEHRAEVKTDVIKEAINNGFILPKQLYDFIFNEAFVPSPTKRFKKEWTEIAVDSIKKSIKKKKK